jgi:hypothetical protein
MRHHQWIHFRPRQQEWSRWTTNCGTVVFLEQICSRLVQAQSMMKLQPEKHHRTLELAVGDWAWLCLNHRTVVSICDIGHSKLAPKLFGPYQVVEHIGPIVYQLKLSPRARVHNVFHVEFLQKYEGPAPPSVPPLPPIVRGKVVPQPDQVLCAQPTSSSWELLVRWVDCLVAEAIWENLEQFKEAYAEFQLEYKLLQMEGENVMDQYFGRQYGHRQRKVAPANEP